MKENLVVGLTGGIACGKTTVAEIFKKFGAEVIDTDSLGHQLLKSDPSIREKLVSAFGNGILDGRGEIDRSKLGRLVFDNPDCLRILNEIIHPPIIELTNAEIKRKLSSGKNEVVVIDAALLIELNLMYMVDSVVLVCADEDTQVRRLIQRGLSQEDAQKRIRSQMPSHEKARFADFIIYTDGSMSDTIKQAEQVWKALTCRIDRAGNDFWQRREGAEKKT